MSFFLIPRHKSQNRNMYHASCESAGNMAIVEVHGRTENVQHGDSLWLSLLKAMSNMCLVLWK